MQTAEQRSLLCEQLDYDTTSRCSVASYRRSICPAFQRHPRCAYLIQLVIVQPFHTWGFPCDSTPFDAVVPIVAELAGNAVTNGDLEGSMNRRYGHPLESPSIPQLGPGLRPVRDSAAVD